MGARNGFPRLLSLAAVVNPRQDGPMGEPRTAPASVNASARDRLGRGLWWKGVLELLASDAGGEVKVYFFKGLKTIGC